MAEKAQFTGVNEHFEAIFNAAEATQIVFQQPVSRSGGLYTPTVKHCVTHGCNVVHRCGRECLSCLRSSCTRLAGPKQLHSSTAPSLNATEIAQRVIRGSTLGSAPGTFLHRRVGSRGCRTAPARPDPPSPWVAWRC